MAKYEYQLENEQGLVMITTQNYKFNEQEILEFFQENQPNKKWIKCTYREPAPKGYHYCGCGNLAKGTKDELCEECQMIYGHKYEHEL
jgi:hypothetical protein